MWNWSENQIRLVMIRHGAAKGNREHKYLGKSDEALSREGEKQLEEYQKRRNYPEIDILFVSPMKRCIQTAKLLYPDMPLFVIEEWEEMDFGVFEGKNYMELQGDERYQAWIDSNGTLPFPGGESREVFVARCGEGFQKMLKKVKQMREKRKSLTVGIIIHGGTIMALLSKYGGGDYFDYRSANGKGYICTVKNIDEKPAIEELKKI